ncbi:hypothetical protein J6590_000508 [Homalodisca vitripennis]|nr:hypothetical protein J6590_000508 [Homalodisca vitripennis]
MRFNIGFNIWKKTESRFTTAVFNKDEVYRDVGMRLARNWRIDRSASRSAANASGSNEWLVGDRYRFTRVVMPPLTVAQPVTQWMRLDYVKTGSDELSTNWLNRFRAVSARLSCRSYRSHRQSSAAELIIVADSICVCNYQIRFFCSRQNEFNNDFYSDCNVNRTTIDNRELYYNTRYGMGQGGMTSPDVVQTKDNRELKDLYTEPAIVAEVRSRRIRWTGHILWKADSTMTKSTLENDPKVRRPLG